MGDASQGAGDDDVTGSVPETPSGSSDAAANQGGAGGAGGDDAASSDDAAHSGVGGGVTVPSEDAGGSAEDGAGGASTGPADDPSLDGEPRNEVRASLNSVRQEHSAAALDGEVYVIGGFTPSVSASVQAYDPQSDTWREVAAFPEPLHHANVATVGGVLYVLGFNRGGSFTDVDGRTFAYDPSADEWSERASMPMGTERASSCVAALGTKIFLFGGSTNTNGNSPSSAESSAYDTELDEWETLPLMPEPREHCVAGAVGEMLYIVSGRSGSIAGVSVESWSYDPQAQEFDERAPIPTPRGGTAGAVVGGKIYVFGGEGNGDDPNGIFHDVEAYEPSTDSWQLLPQMLTGRHGFAAAAVDNRIYLPGGATSQGFGAGDAHTVFFFE